ncbi:MmgE/PrpD family protein [Blastococcus sp. VKM Ac-2987]|uniref:MmgE/PrpD family protein n=1 Tax=Blastococcus sp. VKM Ac-2987 TaxID=3004141 RepID=UPI0022AB7167|nr:MmgE/PrpD family protein [Blastococcus sp. VKM Ac-2987]MCZ2859100.1 MmgE/PrpD family protein [Blastococcus sp. VKM Ac-2987]
MSAATDQPYRALGEFAAGARLADVPGDVAAFARLLLVDTLGALLGGLRYPPVRALARALAADGGPDAGPPSGALIALGTAATWLDADSGGSFHPQGHRLPPVPTAHPAPHALPVLLHAAAAGEVGDRRALEVFLVACEVGLRGGTATSLRPGMHPHGVHGPAAAALAEVLLHDGSAEELTHAFLLGSALPLAATLAVPVHGGTVRNLWTGLGAYYGALAGRRVREAGARGSVDTYRALFDSAVCTDLSEEELAGGLGRRWQLASSYLKPYACARWIQPALDAVLAATDGQQQAPAEIAAVDVRTFAFAAALDAVDVRSDLHARFSLPYCVATLLTDGALDAGSFLPGQLARPDVAELAHRVSVRELPEFSAALPVERPAEVTIRARDGRSWTATTRNARGNPATPLSRAEVEEKFRRNVGELVAPALRDAALDALLDPGPGDGDALGAVARAVLADLAVP